MSLGHGERKIVREEDKKVFGSGGIRTHAPEETGALNQRLRPLGHATLTQNCTHYCQISSLPLQVLIGRTFCTCIDVYGHIMLNTPVLVRSLKLSNIEPS